MIYFELFWIFLQVGLFSIGGGYAAIPLIQSQVVESRGWITLEDFTNLITISEMTPGPIAVNSATFVGMHIAGLPGAIFATLGCIFPSLLIVSALFFLYAKLKENAVMQKVLGALRPAVVALIAGAGIEILLLVVFGGEAKVLQNVQWIGCILFAVAFFVLRKWKANPILVMCACGLGNLLAQSAIQYWA